VGERVPAPRVAYVGGDRQLRVAAVDGAAPRQVSWSTRGGPWGQGADAAAWPAWSPDGRWLACFQSLADGDEPAVELVVVQVDGVEERVLHELRGRLPIHLHWSPDGGRVAALVQRDADLELWSCPLDGEPRLIELGVPLFYAWMPQGDSLLVHVGDGGAHPGRVLLRPAGPGEDVPFRVPPGAFCTPFPMGPRVLYVIDRGEASQLVSCDASGEDLLGIGVLDGLMAFVPSPGGDRVAYASAPGGEGSAYEGVMLATPESGAVERVIEGPVIAFFWTPDGRRLLWATRADAPGRLSWWIWEGAPGGRHLADFTPCREMMFQLHFFEQFAASHALISPDSAWLTWAGAGAEGEDEESYVYVVSLDSAEPRPWALGPGRMGAFAPAAG
jgi:Tol biopolymer transport system component